MPDERFLSLSLDQVKELVHIARTPFEQRVSDLLVEQLRDGLVSGHIHPEKVVQEILSLEGDPVSSKTEPEKPFKGDVLRGFWKKHFFHVRFLAQNLANEMKRDRARSRKLNQLIRQVAKETQDPEAFAARLAHRVVEEPYAARVKEAKLTGEWIVFKKHEGKNYYLTLAVHEERDEAIRDRLLKGCGTQFPFLLK